jgi:hypothetical protein
VNRFPWSRRRLYQHGSFALLPLGKSMLMFIYKNVNAAFDYLTIAMSSFFFVQAAVLAVKAMVGDHADAKQSGDGDGGANTVPLLPSAPPQLLPDTGSLDLMATTGRAQKPGVEAQRSNPLATMHPTNELGL